MNIVYCLLYIYCRIDILFLLLLLFFVLLLSKTKFTRCRRFLQKYFLQWYCFHGHCRTGAVITADSVVLFNVDVKSSKELRQYLSNVAEKCEQKSCELPKVIILDSLHHVSSMADVFNGFLNLKQQTR